MADPKTVGTGPSDQRDSVREQKRGDKPTPEEVGVFGGVLFERRSGRGKTVIRLYGALDRSAAAQLDEKQLVAAMKSGREVCVDVTELSSVHPEALKLFLDRQQAGHRLAQHLSIRINPDQVPDLPSQPGSDA